MVALAAFLLYSPTIRFGLVAWDDETNIVLNPYVQPLSADRLAVLWSRPYGDLYVPLVYTGYAVELAISAGKPWILHLTNTLLHAANAALVCLILWQLVGLLAPAVVGALLFACCPLNTEAVTWVTGRKDVLSAFFTFATILIYIHWRRRETLRFYVAAFAAFVAALLAKPAAVALPLILAAVDLLALQINWKRCARAAVPMVIVAAVFALATTTAQRVDGAYPWWARPLIAGDSILFYARKLVWPAGLSPIYPHAPWDVAASAWFYTALPICLAALGMLWWKAAVSRLPICIAVAALLPVLGLKQFRFQNYSSVADRYMYVAMLGVSLGAAQALRLVPAAWKRLALGIAGIVIVCWAGVTIYQQQFWSSTEHLARRMIEISPGNDVPRRMLAADAVRIGKIDALIEEYRKAAQDHPSAMTEDSLAYALLKKSEDMKPVNRALLEEAGEHYGQAIERDKNYSSSYEGLGRALMQLGRMEDAAGILQQAARLNPYKAGPMANAGLALMQSGHPAEAIPLIQGALKIGPKAEIYAHLANALAQVGRMDEAREALNQGIMLDALDPAVVRVRQQLQSK